MEFGVSHLKSGLNKSLALRCFEIAGQWHDPDSQQHVCYAEVSAARRTSKRQPNFIEWRRRRVWIEPELVCQHSILMLYRSLHCRIYKDKYMSDDEWNPPCVRSRQQTTPGQSLTGSKWSAQHFCRGRYFYCLGYRSSTGISYLHEIAKPTSGLHQ